MTRMLDKGLLVSLPLLFGDHSFASTVPLVKGQSFLEARKALIRKGWQPRITHYKLSDGTPENNFGDSGLFYRAGIREVQFCSGTGSNYCVHNYSNGNSCLRVATAGEYGVGPGPKVEAWYFECPTRLP